MIDPSAPVEDRPERVAHVTFVMHAWTHDDAVSLLYEALTDVPGVVVDGIVWEDSMPPLGSLWKERGFDRTVAVVGYTDDGKVKIQNYSRMGGAWGPTTKARADRFGKKGYTRVDK